MVNAIAMIIVALISLIGVIIQTKSNKKIASQQELMEQVNKTIEDFKKESKEDDIRLNKRLDDIDLENCKRFLIVEMTKLKDEDYRPNEEQKRIIHETKKIYNEYGGNSYVDSMFEDLQKRGIL